jgi:hypothetical protein
MDETPQPLPKLDLQGILLEQQEEKTELDKVLELLLDPNNIRHNTELTQKEITAFSVLATISQNHPELPALKTFLAENLILRVSKKRKGRQEWVKITARALSAQDQFGIQGQDQARRGGIGRFFRGNRR